MPRTLGILCALTALALLLGCFHPHAYARHGHGRHAPVVVHAPDPPPHAPAHGYRHKHAHHGVELVFDSALGVYAVMGLADHFFYDGHYYRQLAGGWEMSVRIDGGGAVASHAKLPRHLPKRAYRHHKKHHKHGQHPAKHKR